MLAVCTTLSLSDFMILIFLFLFMMSHLLPRLKLSSQIRFFLTLYDLMAIGVDEVKHMAGVSICRPLWPRCTTIATGSERRTWGA